MYLKKIGRGWANFWGVKLLIFNFLGGLAKRIILIWLTHRFSIKLLGKQFYLTSFFEPSVMGGGGEGSSGVRVTDANESKCLVFFPFIYIYKAYHRPHLTSKFRPEDQNWGQSFMS